MNNIEYFKYQFTSYFRSHLADNNMIVPESIENIKYITPLIQACHFTHNQLDQIHAWYSENKQRLFDDYMEAKNPKKLSNVLQVICY